MSTPTKFYIGAQEWPGLSKLIEEAGEVMQVAGKLIATDGEVAHWDGTNLRERLTEELADLAAAIKFVTLASGLNIDPRASEKFNTFCRWHDEGKAP